MVHEKTLRTRKWVFAGALIGLVALLAGMFVLFRELDARSAGTDVASDLGIAYVALTGKRAADHGVQYGALVTEVRPGSWADWAGIKVNDVILVFNGQRVERDVSLFNALLACPAGSTVEIRVLRARAPTTLTADHFAYP